MFIPMPIVSSTIELSGIINQSDTINGLWDDLNFVPWGYMAKLLLISWRLIDELLDIWKGKTWEKKEIPSGVAWP
jgi:hypothetical protein